MLTGLLNIWKLCCISSGTDSLMNMIFAGNIKFNIYIYMIMRIQEGGGGNVVDFSLKSSKYI